MGRILTPEQKGRHAARVSDRRQAERIRYRSVADASTLEEKLGILATLLAGSITILDLKAMSATQRISALCNIVQRLQVAQGAQQANDILKLLRSAHAANMARISGKEVRALKGFKVDKALAQAQDQGDLAPVGAS